MITSSQLDLLNQQADPRLSLAQGWLSVALPDVSFCVASLAGDASFRRYFRVTTESCCYILMDAPPELEDIKPFVAIARSFENSAVRMPAIVAMDLGQGFLLLSDFGDQQLLPILNGDTADQLYRKAIDELISMQSHSIIQNYQLPCFDDAQYWREFDIFLWYVQKHLKQVISAQDEKALKQFYQLLIDSAHAQPVVFVHRDYHSRNIMLCVDGELGILDFQDALLGPVTYDLVSLLRDCYIAWPEEQVESWVYYFYEKYQAKNPAFSVAFSDFMRWFDLMGLQRHLKCLGIFCRLYYRDQKSGYLKELPRVLDYVLKICDRYPEFQGLRQFLQ